MTTTDLEKLDDEVLARDRWQIACHEAAHCAVAATLGVRPFEAILFGGFGGGGIAYYDGALAPFPAAIVRAAGGHAERIASLVPPPDSPSPTEDDLPELPPARQLSELESAERRHEQRGAITDPQAVGLFCIRDGGEPEAWARRYSRVHHEARYLVDSLAGTIVRLARRLYLNGRIDVAEIDAFTRPAVEPVPQAAGEPARSD